MKKKIIVFLLIIITTIFSSYKPVQSGYGQWQTSSCYRGIDYAIKRGSYNEYSKGYEWWVKFRNRYDVNVSFSYVLKESSVTSARTNQRTTLRANSEGSGSWFLISDTSVKLFIDDLRFGKDDWGTKYSPCDN